MKENILMAAKTLWDYHQLNHQLQPADLILALGSHDLRVPQRAAELYLEGYAGLVVMSGGLGNFTSGLWTEPEADQFARVAADMGVPQENILIENRSTNTGENIKFTRELLRGRGIDVSKLILVQKPYMERRAYATIRRQWAQPEVIVTSPRIAFADYPTPDIPMEMVIQIMVGDLQRIKKYPALGFQIPQEVPEAVDIAYQFLLAQGFDQHLAG